MRSLLVYIIILCMGSLKATEADTLLWLKKNSKNYTIYYTKSDENNLLSLENYLNKGTSNISNFFGKKFKKTFEVYVYPNRKRLDAQWQKAWNDSTFHSECWMVASGVGSRLDILSFNTWKHEACEHKNTDSVSVQKLITHELMHVFHGQYNPTGNFTDMDDMGWLVEGLATFVSGQLDNVRIKQLKSAEEKGELPAVLKKVWAGKIKYGCAGSIIQYIDSRYGRKKLFGLLVVTNDQQALSLLKTTETELIKNWKIYINKKL